jgi:hypothetical protein
MYNTNRREHEGERRERTRVSLQTREQEKSVGRDKRTISFEWSEAKRLSSLLEFISLVASTSQLLFYTRKWPSKPTYVQFCCSCDYSMFVLFVGTCFFLLCFVARCITSIFNVASRKVERICLPSGKRKDCMTEVKVRKDVHKIVRAFRTFLA